MIRNAVSYVSETVSTDIIYNPPILLKCGELNMKNKLMVLTILFVAALLPAVMADSLTVTIDQPTNNSMHLSNDVLLKSHMNENGTLKYKLDSNSEVVVCNDCSNFQVTLNNMANGLHTVKVTGVTSNETDDSTISFSVNETQDLVVNITQPSENSLHLNNDVILRASMNTAGTLKYKLDSNAEVTACANCSTFSVVLRDLTNGQHTVKVTGTSGSKTDDATVNFTVNQSTTTTVKPKENETGEPRFATGFNKLPQQFASGEISEAQLKSILESNKLNPGVINRLAKTGKLTPSLIDTITETQFLPPGIAGKLLGVLGFGKNNAFESLIKNYNLTDTQLVALFKHSQLPSGTVKHLIKERSLSHSAINALLENQELKPGIIKQLVESQTLTPANVQQLIENQKLNKKVVYTLIQQQLLDNATIEKIKAYGNGDIEKQLEKFQEKEHKRESKQEEDEDEDDDSSEDNERGKSDSARGKKISLGKQKGGDD